MFVCELVKTGSVAAASAKAGLSVAHGYRLNRNPAVRELFMEARREFFRIAMSEALGMLSLAMKTLRAVMSDEEATPGSRVQAAQVVTQFCREGMDLDDLQQRMRAIEEAEGRAPEPAEPGVVPESPQTANDKSEPEPQA